MIFEKTFLGFNAIVNNTYKGLLYHNELYTEIEIGQRMKGYVKQIREDQGLDLQLQKPGIKHLIDTTDQVLQYLQKQKGFLALGDDSSPEEIKKVLNMSKKTFKKSVGILYKQRLIRLEKDGIYLVTADRK